MDHKSWILGTNFEKLFLDYYFFIEPEKKRKILKWLIFNNVFVLDGNKYHN